MNDRTRVLVTATIISSQGPRQVLVRDISTNGAQIYADRRMAEGLDLCFERGGIFVAGRVAWCRNGVAGLKFYRALTEAELHAAFPGPLSAVA